MLNSLSDTQLEQRLAWVESLIHNCRDEKDLPYLNITFQKLLDEQVRRDLEKEN